MNVGLLKTGLKRYGFDDEDPLLMWLQAALDHFEQYAEWPFFQTRFAVTVPSGSNTFTHPDDYVKPFRLRDITGDFGGDQPLLTYWEYNRFERELLNLSDTGKPEIFTTFGGKILLWKVADSDRDLDLTYRRSVPELEDDELYVPEIPTRHHYTLVRGAAYIALQAENEEDRAETAQGQFETDLINAADFYQLSHLGEMDAVSDSMNYAEDY